MVQFYGEYGAIMFRKHLHTYSKGYPKSSDFRQLINNEKDTTKIRDMIKKAKILKELINQHNPKCLIEVDGGVNSDNIQELKEAGVDIVVAGSFVFNHKDGYKRAIESLK